MKRIVVGSQMNDLILKRYDSLKAEMGIFEESARMVIPFKI